MLGPTGITDHPMDGSGLGDNLVNSRSDRFFFSYISMDGKELPGEPFNSCLEVFAGFPDVNGIYFGCAVCETAVRHGEADAC